MMSPKPEFKEAQKLYKSGKPLKDRSMERREIKAYIFSKVSDDPRLSDEGCIFVINSRELDSEHWPKDNS